MQAVSPEFVDALRSGTMRVVAKGEVLHDGVVQRVLDTLTDGAVAIDRAGAVRRSFRGRLVDPDGDLTPREASDLLTPYGVELVIKRGLRLPGGDEFLSLCRVTIDDIDVAVDANGVLISVSAFDRSLAISEARFTEPYVIDAGTNYGTAIKELLVSGLPTLTDTDFEFAPITATTPLIVGEEQGDRWKLATDMATSIGMELFSGARGPFVLRPEPDPSSDPAVWVYAEGEDATIVRAARRLKRAGSKNGVIATGESTSIGAPVRGEAWDDDPASPTYRGNGERPRFFVSSFLTTNGQATDAARALLLRSLGLSEEVSFDAIVNPAHEEGDVINVTLDRAGIDAVHVLEAGSIPMGPATPMAWSTRTRRVVLP